MLGLAFVCALLFPTSAGEITNLPRPTPTKTVEPEPIRPLDAAYRVKIYVNGEHAGSGSGTGIDARHVLTAGHVADTADYKDLGGNIPDVFFMVESFSIYGDTVKRIPARVEKIDVVIDLAVLVVDEDLPFFVKLEYGQAKTGDDLYTVGSPHGLPGRYLAKGTYACKNGFGDMIDDMPEDVQPTYRVLSGAVITGAPGASGSGVWTMDHKFLGVLVRGTEGYIFFVNADVVAGFLKFSK